MFLMVYAMWLLLTALLVSVSPPAANAALNPNLDGAKTSESEAQNDISFHRDVQPILARHCYRCHGEEKQKGFLRLDRRAGAKLGGQSGTPVLGGDEQSNAVLQRVISENPAVRMPKDAEPLSAEEINTLRQWVAAGTPWPDEVEREELAINKAVASNDFLRWYDRLASKHHDLIWMLYYFGFGLLPILLFVLFVERAKASRRVGGLSSTEPRSGIQSFLARVPRSLYLLVVFVIIYAATLTAARGLVVKLEQENRQVRTELAQLTGGDMTAVFGDPPVPFRPSHVSRLGGVYYRGNNERNPALFNRGNYQTAVIRIGLCDGEKQPLERGDAVQSQSRMWVHLEMDRAPFAAEQLFTAAIMERVFLSDRFLREGDGEPPTIVPLNPIVAGERWDAYYPLPTKVTADGTQKGLIYIYQRTNADGYDAMPHYGIKYDLTFTNGRLADASELWMAPLYVPPGVIPPHPTKVPQCEWFDDRPLPVIVGDNTRDSKLLGVDEHLWGSDVKVNATQDP